MNLNLPQGAWVLLMTDPASFVAAMVLALGIGWWFRGFLHKERMALMNDRLEKAREEAKEFGTKLAQAENKNAEIPLLIKSNAQPALIGQSATLAGSMIHDLRIANEALQTTLTAPDTFYSAKIRLTKSSDSHEK